MGQSTKMIGMYNHWNSDCRHIVVEHNEEWIEFFTNHFKLPDITQIIKFPLVINTVNFEEEDGGFEEALKSERFDLICIDGPYGKGDLARMDVISILPYCLNNRFIIILDDYNRPGETNTMRIMEQILSVNGIECCKGSYRGENETGLLVSADMEFVLTM